MPAGSFPGRYILCSPGWLPNTALQPPPGLFAVKISSWLSMGAHHAGRNHDRTACSIQYAAQIGTAHPAQQIPRHILPAEGASANLAVIDLLADAQGQGHHQAALTCLRGGKIATRAHVVGGA